MADLLQNKDIFTPSDNQVKFLEAYLTQEVRMSIEELCNKAGVQRSTYYEWLKKPDFNDWFYNQIQANKHRFAPRILDNLFNQARDTKDKGIIELALRVLDLYTPTAKNINETINITDETLEKILDRAKELITVE
jgi:predicted DNA-binding protein YlxM (UPF0122 family)